MGIGKVLGLRALVGSGIAMLIKVVIDLVDMTAANKPQGVRRPNDASKGKQNRDTHPRVPEKNNKNQTRAFEKLNHRGENYCGIRRMLSESESSHLTFRWCVCICSFAKCYA
jgi:hypothetical protein